MSDKKEKNPSDKKIENNDRRDFLNKIGRFAAVTPPAVAMMLSVTEKAGAQVVASGSPGPTPTPTATATPTPSPTPTPSGSAAV